MSFLSLNKQSFQILLFPRLTVIHCNAVTFLTQSVLRGAPSDLPAGGGWAVFFCAGFLFGGLWGCKIFFWSMLAFFLVVALLHDSFFLTSLPCTIFFLVTAHPPPRRFYSPPLTEHQLQIPVLIKHFYSSKVWFINFIYISRYKFSYISKLL